MCLRFHVHIFSFFCSGLPPHHLLCFLSVYCSCGVSLSLSRVSLRRWYPCYRVASPIVRAIVSRFLFDCSGFIFFEPEREREREGGGGVPQFVVFLLPECMLFLSLCLAGFLLLIHSSGCFRLPLKFLVLALLPRMVLLL